MARTVHEHVVFLDAQPELTLDLQCQITSSAVRIRVIRPTALLANLVPVLLVASGVVLHPFLRVLTTMATQPFSTTRLAPRLKTISRTGMPRILRQRPIKTTELAGFHFVLLSRTN
jgi:hypothetical protein